VADPRIYEVAVILAGLLKPVLTMAAMELRVEVKLSPFWRRREGPFLSIAVRFPKRALLFGRFPNFAS
jgi:hypothetical protein